MSKLQDILNEEGKTLNDLTVAIGKNSGYAVLKDICEGKKDFTVLNLRTALLIVNCLHRQLYDFLEPYEIDGTLPAINIINNHINKIQKSKVASIRERRVTNGNKSTLSLNLERLEKVKLRKNIPARACVADSETSTVADSQNIPVCAPVGIENTPTRVDEDDNRDSQNIPTRAQDLATDVKLSPGYPLSLEQAGEINTALNNTTSTGVRKTRIPKIYIKSLPTVFEVVDDGDKKSFTLAYTYMKNDNEFMFSEIYTCRIVDAPDDKKIKFFRKSFFDTFDPATVSEFDWDIEGYIDGNADGNNDGADVVSEGLNSSDNSVLYGTNGNGSVEKSIASYGDFVEISEEEFYTNVYSHFGKFGLPR